MQGDRDPPAPGVVELREDVPLKAWGGGAGDGGARCCGGGPRLIIACFGALSAAITLALFTQIYYGDYEVVPHGSVSSSAAACSRAGTDVLKAGGRALDAAAAAALCLAVAAPHATSLDASGSLVYWEYRQLRTQRPTLAEWGGAMPPAGSGAGGVAGERPPRLVAALAALHAELGVLPWSRLLQPAIDIARNGFPVSENLAAALAQEAASGAGSAAGSVTGAGGAAAPAVGSLSTAPLLADYLESLQLNTSTELTAAWGESAVRKSSPAEGAAGAAGAAAGGARVVAGGAGAAAALRALSLALDPPPASLDDAQARVVSALMADASPSPAGSGITAGLSTGPATGLAVVDQLDTYVALVTGLSVPFGSGPATAAGWTRDYPPLALDLAPAIMTDQHVCGTRYVLGAESSAALAQVAAALAAGGGAPAVERARLALPPGRGGSGPGGPAVNLVQQTADKLLSHADSRGGGLASRF